jgi:uncharacterized protein YegP (UPF0339 family)
MATATKKARVASSSSRVASTRFAPTAFQVFENNSGDYQWVIVSKNDAVLASSGPFATYREAERAAIMVRDGAGAAAVAPRNSETRLLVTA